jgi:hypothetical protein
VRMQALPPCVKPLSRKSLRAVTNDIFDGGPPSKLEAWTRLRRYGDRRVLRLAVSIAAIAWLPLVLLSAASGNLIHAPGSGSFLKDFAVHARCLIAIPLLVLGEAICIPRLGAIALQFRDSHLIRDSERGKFDAALASTRDLRDSTLGEFVVLVLAYLIVVAVAFSESAHFPAWHMAGTTESVKYSPAGLWNVLVSLPLLMVLLLAWIWRLFLWTRLLWLISRLDLHLLVSHPDRAGGLMFAAYSVRAWVLPAVVPSVVVAGTLANRVVHDGASLLSYKFLMLGVAVFVVVLFAAPLMVFNQRLLATWNRGVLGYSALAARIGHEFESLWVRQDQFPADPMQTAAFSATTDLYSIVGNVYQMKLILVDPKSIVSLLVMALLPFLPLVLMTEPLSVVLKQFAGFLS